MKCYLKPSDTLNDEEYLNKVCAKLIKCNFDGASLMSASVSEVLTRMNKRQNGLIYKHYTAHQLGLEVRDLNKFDNYLDRFDEFINIFKLYY